MCQALVMPRFLPSGDSSVDTFTFTNSSDPHSNICYTCCSFHFTDLTIITSLQSETWIEIEALTAI